MMSLSLGSTFYIIGAFAFTGIILMILTLWSLQSDRKARQKLEKKEAVEIVFHPSRDYEEKALLKTSKQNKQLKGRQRGR